MTTTAFGYSDGDAVETRLLRVLQDSSDVSSASEELQGCITDWPSEYHLSQARHNLLRPFTFGPGDRILELGCGCGALTRYLGETGAEVVAVEGSERRAAIAKERCRDLSNVSIHCENLVDFRNDKGFDYVLLIGVLEYAPKYIAADNPVHTCLERAGALLAENGTLILAIENQLGLKYFSGCDEDHLGIPYYGINGLYRADEPVTFGRRRLARLLTEAGFSYHNFYYPFPDYKLPAVILGETALCNNRINIADLLLPHIGRNYPENGQRVFAESLAWRSIVANALLPDLANSFLVTAKTSSAPKTPSNWLAIAYGQGRRRPCYQVETAFVESAGGELIVRKERIHPAAHPPENPWLDHVVADSSYRQGAVLVSRVHLAMARGAGLDELAECFLPWLDFLLEHASENVAGSHELPPHFVDCIPANLIETEKSELYFFDNEWVSSEPIPLAWPVIRGIFNSLINCFENPVLAHLSYRQLITAIASKVGIIIGERDFAKAVLLEQRLQQQCMISTPGHKGMEQIIDEKVGRLICLSSANVALRSALALSQQEVARIKNTVSWRVTKPVRAIWNISRRLFTGISAKVK